MRKHKTKKKGIVTQEDDFYPPRLEVVVGDSVSGRRVGVNPTKHNQHWGDYWGEAGGEMEAREAKTWTECGTATLGK